MSILKKAAERNSAAEGPVVTMGTDAVPAPDRFGRWSDLVGQEVMRVTMTSLHATRFEGRAEAVRLPHSMVADFTCSPMTARRSPVRIRRQDPEDYLLVLVADGSAIRLEQGRGTACLGSGDLALISTSHPMLCEFVDLGGPVRSTHMRLPRSVLPPSGGHATRTRPSAARGTALPRGPKRWGVALRNGERVTGTSGEAADEHGQRRAGRARLRSRRPR
ncbi:hypothetical protein [Streptomyces sp. NPDC058632]|uniref:AraC-like ligand-binding domain-containing protein n=1 Tax=unclassified Streptomyces TaxID=2593676 RepID=UPI0036659016